MVEPLEVPAAEEPRAAEAQPDPVVVDVLGLVEEADTSSAPLIVAQNDPSPPAAEEPPTAPEAEENRAMVEQRTQQIIQIDAETADLRQLVKLHRLNRLDQYAAKKKWVPGLKPPDLSPQEKVWWKEWDQAQRPPLPSPPAPPAPPASVPAP